MKIASDTSVLVVAVLSTHPDHARAVVWPSAVFTGLMWIVAAIDNRRRMAAGRTRPAVMHAN